MGPSTCINLYWVPHKVLLNDHYSLDTNTEPILTYWLTCPLLHTRVSQKVTAKWSSFFCDWPHCSMRTQQVQNLSVVAVMCLALTVQLFCATSVVKMAASLTSSTKEEQCAVISFLWAEGVRSAEITCRLSAQHGDCFAGTRTSGLTRSKTTKNDQCARPHRRLKGILNKSASWLDSTRVAVDKGANQCLWNHPRLTPLLWSFIQVGFWKNSRNCVVLTVWTSVTTFWASIMRKVTSFCIAISSDEMRIRCYETENRAM
jgi:hypothetical protein